MVQEGLRILIADDDAEDLELIEEAILTIEPNAQLHMVDNGKAAVDYLSIQQDNKLPALIILDYNMPQLNAAQVLSVIGNQTRYRAIPKIILSTSNSPLHIHECKVNGALEYFVKPNTLPALNLLAQKILHLAAGN